MNILRESPDGQKEILRMNDNLSPAKQSLDGLSVGDAFGELFFVLSPHKT